MLSFESDYNTGAHPEILQEKVHVSFWEIYDETHSVIRFATSWSTTDEDLNCLEEILRTI